MPAENLVIVESPAKAKTINRYLGTGYRVLATLGHIRDLPKKQGMVDPNESFRMHWETLDGRKDIIRELAKAVSETKYLWLATDPDREGEAIAWHLNEIFKKEITKGNVRVNRIVFHEITASAIKTAIKNPRPVDINLVDAYQARRALDYLVGFTLSPVLWRKLPGTRSAGRVQSVALRLICEREDSIIAFKSREYWSISGLFNEDAAAFTSLLSLFDGKKIGRMTIEKADEAETMHKRLQSIDSWRLINVELKESSRNPAPPFTTSTLQQEASRKLGFSSSKTMQVAQRLYEGVTINGVQTGLITYMRTDNNNISKEAVSAIRDLIDTRYGNKYLPEKPQQYRNRARNAQEAHEAIRPTNLELEASATSELGPDESKLYALIWKRALASQMTSARLAKTVYRIGDESEQFVWRASGTQVVFDGFTRLYSEGHDDDVDAVGTDTERLPRLEKGQSINLAKITQRQHFTQPPARYNEASLVRKLEELGIGRPSTYASIMRVIRDREYASMEAKRFMPTSKGQLLTGFLLSYFARYVAYEFTAGIEDELDKIAKNQLERLKLLETFWKPFQTACDSATAMKNRDVLDILDKRLEPVLFPDATEDTIAERRQCPHCKQGRLSLKSGRYGGFLGCSDYPTCKYVKQLDPNQSQEDGNDESFPRSLGTDLETGLEITLRKGPYGLYVQRDTGSESGSKEKPRRASLGKDVDPQTLDLASAIRLLSLPRDIGTHPDTGETIVSQIGRFGPYVRHKSTFASIPKDETPWTIGLNRAVMLIAESEKKPKRAFRSRKQSRPKAASS